MTRRKNEDRPSRNYSKLQKGKEKPVTGRE